MNQGPVRPSPSATDPTIADEHRRTLALLDEVVIGSARGGRRPQALLEIEYVRSLEEGDVELLVNPPPVVADPSRVMKIRQSHHLLARTMAEGHSQEHVSLITGYSPSYISSLKGDPAFAELLSYYATQKEQVFVDVMERMRVLGLHTLEELQSRLTEAPDEWSKRELMELSELMLIKGRAGPGMAQGSGPQRGGGAEGPGVTVNVKFVSAGQGGADVGPIIDITPSAGPGEAGRT